MALESDKKIVLLYVLDILRDFSDENHLLKYSDIISKLNICCGISPNVKSIARNIDTLIEYGYKIQKNGKNGCYLVSRDFDDSEIMFLVDAVFSSKLITSDSAKNIIKKLTKDCSLYKRKKYKHIYKVNEISRAQNSELFNNIEILEDAIEQNKKITFNYNQYNVNKKFLPRNAGKIYKISPYFLVNNNGKYYLVCNYEKYDNLANYKIECISNIEIIDEKIRPLISIPGYEKFKQNEYINEHIYMTAGQSVNATIKIDDERYVNYIIEWFGDDVKFEQKNNSIFASLKVNEQALIYWALQYGEFVEITSPIQTREKIKESLKNVLNKYNNK